MIKIRGCAGNSPPKIVSVSCGSAWTGLAGSTLQRHSQKPLFWMNLDDGPSRRSPEIYSGICEPSISLDLTEKEPIREMRRARRVDVRLLLDSCRVSFSAVTHRF
ncbi:hypothetical protein F2P81_001571 [Scophthalmus maximus]|uniref:Uncharacterized protein n=1 Tax=Scophthalmus maximus TaxID=52904 RepID=A0A6A4TSK9_SCOMX|nr:hypothetical protein F2P81_001571 [Scophthalmus maximus]